MLDWFFSEYNIFFYTV